MWNTDEGKISFLAAGNLLLSGAGDWLVMLEPWLHSLLQLGQILVALATVVYIVKKTLLLKSKRRAKKQQP